MTLVDVFQLVSLGFVMALGVYVPAAVVSHVVRSLSA